MLDAAGRAWQKIQEFMKDISTLKDHDAETDKELERFRRELDLVHKELGHHDKIQNVQGQEMSALAARIKKLESEKHGLAVKLGLEKKKNGTGRAAKH